MRDRDKKEIKEIGTKKSEEITMQEWEEYFVKLREKGRRKGRRKGRNTKEGEADGDGGNKNHSK
jgi:hypothetical protein